ncbi:6028_t:CDS:1, partial [Dentiscutata heterogama]
KANYTIKPVHECMGDTRPYVENVTLAVTTTKTTIATPDPPPFHESTPTHVDIITSPTQTPKTSDATNIFKNDLLSSSLV